MYARKTSILEMSFAASSNKKLKVAKRFVMKRKVTVIMTIFVHHAFCWERALGDMQ